MSGFIGPAVLLVLAAALFVVWPLLRQQGSAGNAPGSAPGSAPERRGALLTALAIAAVAAALYGVLHAGAGGPAEATSTNANGTASGPAESDTIVSLVRSTQRHPDDVQSWLDLGRAYLRANQWGLARRSFRRADTLSGGHSAPALVGLAQTIVMENNGTDTDASIELYDRAAKIDPRSPQALFYTAVALMHGGYLEQARDRFQSLLALNPPPSVSDAIRKEIASLDQAIVDAATAAKLSAATALHLNIDLAPALRGRVKSGASLFVFVRAPQGGAPLAAKRLTAQFPQLVDLSAADSMIADHSFKPGQKVQVVARVSVGGTPTAQAGDLTGQIAAVAGQKQTLSLLIDQGDAKP